MGLLKTPSYNEEVRGEWFDSIKLTERTQVQRYQFSTTIACTMASLDEVFYP